MSRGREVAGLFYTNYDAIEETVNIPMMSEESFLLAVEEYIEANERDRKWGTGWCLPPHELVDRGIMPKIYLEVKRRLSCLHRKE